MKGREITLAETLEMHGVYMAGAMMDEVAAQFHIRKGSVSKAFARWNLHVRPRGFPARPKIETKPIIAVIPRFQPPRSWCLQCDRLVSTAEAGQCGSRFCAVKHLATGLAISGCEADKFRSEGEIA